MLAVILASGAPERLSTALSLLVCTAADGEPAHGLVSHGALGALVADRYGEPADVVPAEREPFLRTLRELRALAIELDAVKLWACSAAVSASGLSAAAVEEVLDGVRSTPLFLQATAGARLVVV
jgi:peroxiredoxin family protein